MKSFLRRRPVKVLLSVFFICSILITTLGCVASVAILSNYNSLFSPPENVEKKLFDSLAVNAARSVYNKYASYCDSADPLNEDTDTVSKKLLDEFSSDKCNFVVRMTDKKSGNVLFENFNTEELLNTVETSFQRNVTYPTVVYSSLFPSREVYYEYIRSEIPGYTSTEEYTDADGVHVKFIKEATMPVTTVVTCGILSNPQPVDELYYEIKIVEYAVYLKNLFIPVTLLFLVLSVVLAWLLCIGAGQAVGTDTVKLMLFDKLPYELFLCVIAGIVLLTVLLLSNSRTMLLYMSAAASCILWSFLILWLIMGTARRAKHGNMWKNTVVCYLLKFFAYIYRSAAKTAKYMANNIGIYWKAVLVYIAVTAVELIVIGIAARFNRVDTALLFIWGAEKVITLPLITVVLVNVRRIINVGQKLAHGEADCEINTSYMLPELKKHMNNLSSIGDGMKLAISEQLKSERMQTELITNVSHDIKTPLTSIISYVNLLEKEDMPSDRARGYLEVIDRQSNRLKKLAVDVVEASKAAAGSIEVNSERTDVNVLLGQVTAEYDDRLSSARLELVEQTADKPLFIYADNRLIWRVLDNLMNNICKYSQGGTRIYIEAYSKNGKVEISFKNVSKSPLNISADELMERFVRGDASRNTEGSGLGLAISRSLTELQGGSLELIIDGDLFKAVLTFPQI